MKFNVKVRAILLATHPSKILLYRYNDKPTYYLPGIDVEPGMQVIDCLKLYLKDIFGIDPKTLFFTGVMEHITGNDHIFTLFFKVDEFAEDITIPAPKNVLYEWKILPLERRLKFEPEYLKEDLSRWIKGKEIFLSTKEKAFSA